MDIKSLSNILGEGILPQEVMNSLQEAFDAKVAKVREEAEMAIREEFARRFEADKAQLVEAMDLMLTDVIREHEEAKLAEIKKLNEARNEARKAVKEARGYFKAKLAEATATQKKFVMETVSKQVAALKEQKRALKVEAMRIAEAHEAKMAELAEAQSARAAKIDEFVIRGLQRELREFNEDHRALVKSRAKLIAEGRKKLAAVQSKFVAEAAKKVEAYAKASVSREMKQLHEDVERYRQNSFGRRIFEAVASEFMSSYLLEGTEIRKLQTMLEGTKKELANAKSVITEAEKKSETAVRKAQLAEDRAVRTKIMSELLSNLRGEKRAVMEGMLETVKTDQLRASFDKLMPVVLAEGSKPAPKKPVAPAQEKRTIAVTGDRPNRLVESAQDETEFNRELSTVIRLAGISK